MIRSDSIALSKEMLIKLGFQIPSVDFAEEIAAFSRDDRNLVMPVNVLFVGDSDIRRWDKTVFARHFGDLNALNRGFGGARTWEILIYFDRLVLPHRPRLIVYCAGDNDIAKLGADGVESAVRGFELFIMLVKRHVPEVERVFYLAIHPSPCDKPLWGYIEAANKKLRKLCSQTALAFFVDYLHLLHDEKNTLYTNYFEADGLHFTAQFYERLSCFLSPLLRVSLGRCS